MIRRSMLTLRASIVVWISAASLTRLKDFTLGMTRTHGGTNWNPRDGNDIICVVLCSRMEQFMDVCVSG